MSKKEKQNFMSENHLDGPSILVFIITGDPYKAVTIKDYEDIKTAEGQPLISYTSESLKKFLNRMSLTYEFLETIPVDQLERKGALYLAESRADEGIDILMSISQRTGVNLNIRHIGGSELSLLPLKMIMERLRSTDGCNFDREQTHQTLKPYLMEEAQEVIEAIDTNESRELKEELGDLLLQVIFHSQIAEENGEFKIEEVLRQIEAKLIRRHPHVFGGEYNKSGESILSWEEIKKVEQNKKGETLKPKQEEKKNTFLPETDHTSHLDQLPEEKSALLQAEAIQQKCRELGFDWDTEQGAYEKFNEEVDELSEAYEERSREKLAEELGDLLFAIVNLSRFFDLSPELCLRNTISKFKRRFKYIEDQVKENKGEFSKYNLEELDNYWNEAKKRGF